MKNFKFILMGLLFISLPSKAEVESVETVRAVAPPIANIKFVDVSTLDGQRVISLKKNVKDPQNMPVTLEQVVSLSESCQDPTVIDSDGLTFSIDNNEPETCVYQYTVKNHTGDSALDDKAATATNYVLTSNQKLLPQISEATIIGESLTIDLEEQLAEKYPEGYVLDEDIVVDGSGEAIANTSTKSITFTSYEEGVNILFYTLNDPNSTESEMGTIWVTVVGLGNTGPVAEDFLGPQNLELGEIAIIDVADHISDPDGDDLNLVDVSAFSATVEIIDNPNGNNTQFSFVGNELGSTSVNYTVSDNRGGFASAFVTIVIPARTTLPWGDISFDNVLVYAAPWEKEVADGENIGYTTTQKEIVDGIEYDIALFDYDNAGFICERYDMVIPTEAQLLDLFNYFNSQGINIQDADGNSWPVGANYLSSESNVSVNLVNGDVNDSESPETPLILTCVFPTDSAK